MKVGDRVSELRETFSDIIEYLTKTFVYVKPIWAFFGTVITYVMFPSEYYVAPAIAVVIAMIIDIGTKYYSIAARNGGLYEAIKTRKISSESLWRGTKRKMISVLVVMILCGTAYRLTPISGIAMFFTSFCYTMLFIREWQSVIENLLDAGHEDLRWLLFFLKKKEKEVLEKSEER